MKILFGSILVFFLLATPAPLAPGAGAPATTGEQPAEDASEESSPGSLEDFIPSEEVPADSAISFPVDI